MVSRPVLGDVARLAGVSAMTVSNVMNGKQGVAEATRKRVLDAAAVVGYVPNLAARGLARGRTNLIGVISHDLTVQYAWEIVRGITDQLAEVGLEILISATYQDASRELERVRFLTNGLVDGVILIGPVLEAETLESLKTASTPSVIVDPRKLDLDHPRVFVDNYGGARAAVDHLIALGHTRIALLEGDPTFDSSRERRRGYEDALAAASIGRDPQLYGRGDFTQSGGFTATMGLLELPDRPTAIFATADVSAMGAIDAARARGLDIPSELSVVGFDDIPQAQVAFPALTTVRQPLEDSGRQAVQLLLQLIAGEPLAEDFIELPTTLVLRETAVPPGFVANTDSENHA
jgi:LacI family transcriptional regulator